ncbi:MAG: putative LPS assembly protein LptD [Flavipsychrobacter sp.]|nr:putative LPS assembly protein LptD [Flavipsychrobacter sp.]
MSGKFISKFASFHHQVLLMVVFFLLYCLAPLHAQNTIIPATTDTTASISDSTHSIIDTNASKNILNNDSSKAVSDTSKNRRLEDSLGITISHDALPGVVKSEAVDSAVLDMQTNLFFLYGQAQVNYQDLQLNAGKISYQQSTDIVTAQPTFDSLGIAADRPSFSQGSEKFTYDSLQYNFKSKRAIVRNVRSQYGEGYVFSQQIKRNPDQSIFGWRNVYTTCALDTPHFGIIAKKIKVIPGKIIATGSANIVIEGVPTPIFLPFGLFPISQTQRSGFMLPTYTIEQARGLGLTNGGYYFYLSDHADLLTEANIYTKGSYALSGVSTYRSIYQYSGGVSFSYALNKTGQDYEPGSTTEKDFMINWRHQTDAKAEPGQTFNASVQAGTSTFYSNNSYDPNQILQNQYSSNITYSKNWIGTPYSLTLSALHSQDTRTRQVNVTLPSINFHVTQLNPFQNKRSSKIHWYDKITTSYSLDGYNTTTFYDSAFHLNTLGLGDFHNAIHHTIPVSASYTILRFINMSFSVNYNEYWFTERLYQNYDPASLAIDSNYKRGFYTARDFNTGVQFTTRIYGMKMFKSGKIKGIRHVLTPNIGFVYHPDFASSPYNYAYRSRINDSNYQVITPFFNSQVGTPPIGKAGSVNFGLNNNLQIKVRSSKDTVTGFKNVTLIDGLGITTAYNIAADSFNLSPFAINFRTNILDKINISSSANYDPYAFNYNTGQRVNQIMLENGSGIARFTNASFSLGSNFHSAPLKTSGPSPTTSEEYTRVMRNNGAKDYVDFNIPWSFNFNYVLTANSNYSPYSKKDTVLLSQNITLQGDFNLTERWKVTVNTGFNVTMHQITFTSIDVYRDLHCWQFHFQAIPFGDRKSYNFTLNVKAAVLQDLKITRRRDFRDAAN